MVAAKHRPGSVLETEKLSGLSRVSLHIGSVELADTGEQPIRSLHDDQSEAFIIGNYTCVSDTHTATVLLVVTVREADTGPEGLKTVNMSPIIMSSSSVITMSVSVVFCVILAWK